MRVASWGDLGVKLSGGLLLALFFPLVLVIPTSLLTISAYLPHPHPIPTFDHADNMQVVYAPVVVRSGQRLENVIVVRPAHTPMPAYPHQYYYPLVVVHGKNIVIRNVIVYGNMLQNHAQSVDGGNIGILVHDSSCVRIKDVKVVNVQGDALNIHNSRHVYIKNVEAYNEEIYPYCGLAIGGSAYITVRNFRTFGFNHGLELYHPIDGVRQNHDLTFIDCLFYSHPQPTKHVGSAYIFEAREARFVRCHFNDCILVTGEQTFYTPTVDDLTFVECRAPLIEVCYRGNVGKINIEQCEIPTKWWDTHG